MNLVQVGYNSNVGLQFLVLESCDELVDREGALFACDHILHRELAALHLALAYHHDVGDGVVVGKGHLLLHLLQFLLFLLLLSHLVHLMYNLLFLD